MASRVNVKFVVLLSVALGLTFLGVAGALYYVKFRSGDRYAALAKEAETKGDFETADKFYGRAVGKEHGRVEWLRAWRDVRAKLVPPTESTFGDSYRMYLSILSSLATVEKTPQAFHDALEAQYQTLLLSNSRKDWDSFAGQVEDFALRNFPADAPPTTLRRYRGLAIVKAMELAPNGKDEVPAARQKAAREDLDAAFKADPKDFVAGDALAEWHMVGFSKAWNDNNPVTKESELAAVQGVDAALLAANPDEPQVLVNTFYRKLRLAQLPVEPSKIGLPETTIAVRAAIEKLRPQLDQIAERLGTADPNRLDMLTLDRFSSLAIGLEGKDGAAKSNAAVDHALSGRPTDPDLLALKANSLLLQGDLENSITAFDKVIKLPPPTVGLVGARLWSYRRSAVFLQADAAAKLIGDAKDATARAAAVSRATAFRQEVAKAYPANAPQLKLVDGEMRYYQADMPGAQAQLAEFLRAPGDARGYTDDAKYMMAQIGLRTGQLGLARQNLLELKQSREATQRPSLPFLLMLAQIEVQLEHPQAAADYCRQALVQDPQSEDAKKMLAMAQALSNKDSKLDDPVLQRIADAARTSRGDAQTPGDDKKAMQILQDGLESSKYDTRLVGQLVQYQLMAGDREGATRTVEAALAKRPDDAGLKASLDRIKGSATLEGTLKLIDEMQGTSDLDKCLARFQTYNQFNKPDEAKKALDEAAKLAPNDVHVLEFRFVTAIQAGDLATASQIVDQAVAADADHAGGNTFKARLLLAQGNLRDAISTLQRVVDRGSAPPIVHQLLGEAQLQAGRALEGLDSLRHALELSPNDTSVVKVLITSLAQLGRVQEALDTARASEGFARRDPEFMNLWLALEAAAGNKQLARERREAILAQSPTDNANKAALAEIYIDQHVWDKARGLLDDLRSADPTSTRYAALDARWNVEQGNLTGARKAYEDTIKAVRDKAGTGPVPAAPFVSYAQFLIRYSQVADGLAQIREAEKTQDPKTMAVTAFLGDTEFDLGMYAQAEAAYRSIAAAGIPDPKRRIQRRLIDSLLLQTKYEEAAKELASIGADADADFELLTQRSEAARGLGDKTKAMDLLNTAIAKFPEEPLPYYRRARLVMSDPTLIQDAMADLATAIKLRPGLWQALRTRYGLELQLGKTAEAIRDLRAAVDANPSMDSLRFELIDVLIANNQSEDAAAVADAALKGRSGDTRLILTLAQRFDQAGDHVRAARYCKQVFDVGQEAGVAMLYVGALLSSNPPALAEAESALAASRLNVEKSWPLLMARALLRMKQNNEDAARADIANALGLVSGPADLSRWYDRFRLIYPDAARAAEILSSQRVQPALGAMLAFYRARCLMEAPGAKEKADGAKALSDLAAQPGLDTGLRTQVYQYLCVSQADPAAAIQACRDGLTLSPDDVMLNNNLASLLSDKQQKHQDALPYAEKALAGAPQSAQVMDTLAKIRWALGQKDQAIQTETQALRTPQAEVDKVPLALQLAHWKLLAGDRRGAVAMADVAAGLVCDYPSVIQKFKPELDQLNRDIRNAPQ